MPRGRREKPKLDGAKLPEKVDGLLPSEQSAYLEIRSDLNRHGFGQRADLQVVVLASRRLARVRMLADMVARLQEITIIGGNGQLMVHPLCKELRSAEHDLSDSMRVLLLSPGSRKSVRTGGREMEQEADSSDSKTAKLLKLMP